MVQSSQSSETQPAQSSSTAAPKSGASGRLRGGDMGMGVMVVGLVLGWVLLG